MKDMRKEILKNLEDEGLKEVVVSLVMHYAAALNREVTGRISVSGIKLTCVSLDNIY